jgi:hypothetical protein
MDRIVTFGKFKKNDRQHCLCDLKDKSGRVFPDFPIHPQAFQIVPTVGDAVAFMTWEVRDDPKVIRIHQSACVIPYDRFEELMTMKYEEAEQSLIHGEFSARSMIADL